MRGLEFGHTVKFLRNNRIPYLRNFLSFRGPIPHGEEFSVMPVVPGITSVVELRSGSRSVLVSGEAIKRLVTRLHQSGEARNLRHAIEIIRGG